MRIRTIKPQFFFNDELYQLEIEEHLPVRLAYIGLWCAADREGRFKDEPKKLKAQILPYDDDVDFSRVLHALATRGFLVMYMTNDCRFWVIPTFKTHQFVNNREAPSVLPDPSECQRVDACFTRDSREDDACLREGKGRELNISTPLIPLKGEGGSRRKPKFDPLTVELPECLQTEAGMAAWIDYCNHRKEKNNPLKPTGTKNALAKLAAMGPDKAVHALRESIANGWTGVFEPSGNGNGGSGATSAFQLNEAIKRIEKEMIEFKGRHFTEYADGCRWNPPESSRRYCEMRNSLEQLKQKHMEAIT